jgi:acyl-CoA reductase-like NAD-dependent aldehyde dehydrogenase
MSTSTLTYQLFIDGAWADSSGDEALDVVNPATEEVIGTVPQATPPTSTARSPRHARRSTRGRGPG